MTDSERDKLYGNIDPKTGNFVDLEQPKAVKLNLGPDSFKEKESEEEEIIMMADRATAEVREELGLPEAPFNPGQIRIVKASEWPSEVDDTEGILTDKDVVLVREQEQRLEFLEKALHEIIHVKAAKPQHPNLFHDQESDGRLYTSNLSEALTASLTISLMQRLKDDPLFRDEVEAVLSALREDDPDAKFGDGDIYAVTSEETAGGFHVVVSTFPYQEERKMLNALLWKIFDNTDQFGSPREILVVLLTAMFSGDDGRVCSLLDGAFGDGTTEKFKALGDDVEKQRQFVESLAA